MDERLQFVARRLDGEPMGALCEEFGISRKTGYKIFERYRQVGVAGLTDRSRRPRRHANQLPVVVERSIVGLKREYPSWGAPKIRERLKTRWPAVHCPAISTVHAVLDRHGLVQRRSRRRRPRLTGTPLSGPVTPNRLWCADYKGEFLLSNQRYCYPLTVTDFATRYLIACEALTWVISTMRPADSNRSIIPSVRNCYPCLRNRVSPMSPEWTWKILAPRAGFEPTSAEATAGRPATLRLTAEFKDMCRSLRLSARPCRTSRNRLA